MSYALQCPNPDCGKKIQSIKSLEGKRIRCGKCGQAFRAGSAGAEDSITEAGVPKTIGRFQIGEQLGAGAFGAVYRAHDSQLDREIALKLPHAGTLTTPARVQRFLREARAAAQLRHPAIVPVYEAGQHGEQLYIASAFIAGKPLSDAIDPDGEPCERAARLVRELAEALAYAHEQGIVHRDVKPDNVMLDEQDRPHLMDFGLASRQEQSEKLTHDGAILGTPS